MALTAVAIVGAPDSVRRATLARLEGNFPNGYLFRFKAAKTRGNRSASYSDRDIDDALDCLSDAAFGSSTRPLGFCRHSNSGCALTNNEKKPCRKTSASTCSLKKPDYLILAYQAGPDSGRLLKRLHFSTYAIEIPQGIYGASEATATYLEAAIRAAVAALPRISQSYGQGASPFLLPPLNFGGGKLVDKLLVSALASPEPDKIATAFRRCNWDKSQNSFKARSDLRFAPAKGMTRHGNASDEHDPALALSKHYRLGCCYHDEFHWDVRPGNRNDLGGTYPFYCRCAPDNKVAKKHPKGRYINVLIDDCLR